METAKNIIRIVFLTVAFYFSIKETGLATTALLAYVIGILHGAKEYFDHVKIDTEALQNDVEVLQERVHGLVNRTPSIWP